MKAFRATGSYRAGKRDQPFSVDVVATDEDDAMERILSNFGSRHRVTRRFILVDGIAEIDPADSVAPVVQSHFGVSAITSVPKTEEE
ncbi:MAG: 50S ribosomal protein L18Ae [Candidatus Thalassarchaeaceae archaeon]|jgi:ribosomal protein L20A (L18A)|nr:50S ribosomal protein L18Ae [Candidatus Thalassarchaeaceae archaeon]